MQRNDPMVLIRAVLGSCVLLILAGCSGGEAGLGKLVPVKGKVTTARGTPLPGGQVTFIPLDRDPNAPGVTSGGKITPEGNFQLFTKGKPGAPLGKYRVVLARGTERKGWNRVPPQYSSQEKSPLEVEVAEEKPEGGYDLKIQTR
jgi:hypothetical protein